MSDSKTRTFVMDGPDFDLAQVRHDEKAFEKMIDVVLLAAMHHIQLNPDWIPAGCSMYKIVDKVGNSEDVRYLRFRFITKQ